VLATAKSAPLNSLTSKISVVLAKSLNSEGGLSKMCYLWLELVDRLTARWENAEDIVGYIVLSLD
jgi:hypothetical protein